MASELVRRLRENDPHGWPIASKETMTEAADALDAADRDVAELVAALDEARDKFWVFRCNFGKQMPERQLCEKLCADFAVLLAKHKGGARG